MSIRKTQRNDAKVSAGFFNCIALDEVSHTTRQGRALPHGGRIFCFRKNPIVLWRSPWYIVTIMQTDKRLQKLEKEIETIWRVIDENRAWHNSVVTEVRRRSLEARREHQKGKLRSANKVFA